MDPSNMFSQTMSGLHTGNGFVETPQQQMYFIVINFSGFLYRPIFAQMFWLKFGVLGIRLKIISADFNIVILFCNCVII